MVRVLICFIILIFSINSYSQDCNIGTSDNTGFDGPGDFIRDNLLGIKLSLDYEGVLRRVCLNGQTAGAQVQMAIYDDNNGVPNNLITFTEVNTVETGLNFYSVEPVQLAPGDYWVMAIYDIDGVHVFKKGFSQTVDPISIYYTPLSFGDPIPENASDFLDYLGGNFTYFLEIDCGLVATEDIDSSSQVSIFPNPSSDLINITNLKDGKSIIEVYDASSKRVLTKLVETEQASLDISEYQSGTYFLVINNKEVRTIVKF